MNLDRSDSKPSSSTLKVASYLSVFSRSDASRVNAPLMVPTNVLGSLMLESGMMPLVARLGNVVGPEWLDRIAQAMPIAMIGVEVNEEMHRFDVRALPPDGSSGVRAANAVGEAIGNVQMKWMVAPDDFEPALGRVPPPTPLDQTRSQRFVMLDGKMQFADGRGSGLRGLGSGRTFPVFVNGQHQLRIGAVVDVIEGFGNLKGLSGTIVVNGYITPPTGLFINFVARFLDPDGQLNTDAAIARLVSEAEPDPRTTFLVLLGEVDPDLPVEVRTAPDGKARGWRVTERLRMVHTEFDVGSTDGLRAKVAEGPLVGRVTSVLEFDPRDPRPISPIRTTDSVFSFLDPSGHVVGTLAANLVEGRAFKATVNGQSLFRMGGFGPLLSGTGSFEGAVGMLSMNGVVGDAPGNQANLYVIRISDAERRLRASLDECWPHESRSPVGGTAAGLSAWEEKILARVEKTRSDGLQLQEWVRRLDAGGACVERLEIVREFNRDDRSYGFFDTVAIDGRQIPVQGVVQHMLFDDRKNASATATRDQLREFVLRYFMRTSHTRQPEVAVASDHDGRAPFMRPLSWLPEASDRRVGFGYEQVLYKRKDTGRVASFRSDERGAIVDLRTIGTDYDWVTMRVNLFDFNIGLAPWGPQALKMALPLREVMYLVLAPETIIDRDDPSPDVLGEYGFGYGLMCHADQSPLVYGPGCFAVGYQSIVFELLSSGVIRVKASFLANRPEKILSVDIDPIAWGFKLADLMTFDMASKLMGPVKTIVERLPLRVQGVDPISTYISAANLLTGGLAERTLGISMTQLEKRMLAQHFMQHYDMLTNSRLMWLAVPDWTDPKSLPELCHRGMAI
jgi:hypothetical protein